jgi:hypothetical protein
MMVMSQKHFISVLNSRDERSATPDFSAVHR